MKKVKNNKYVSIVVIILVFKLSFTEACHKLIRKFRANLSRKTSLIDNLTDIISRLFLKSSPKIRCQKPKARFQRKPKIIVKNEDDTLVESFFDD